MEYRRRESESEVYVSTGHIPHYHVPVSGGAEQLTTTAVPAVELRGWRERGGKMSEKGGIVTHDDKTEMLPVVSET